MACKKATLSAGVSSSNPNNEAEEAKSKQQKEQAGPSHRTSPSERQTRNQFHLSYHFWSPETFLFIYKSQNPRELVSLERKHENQPRYTFLDFIILT